MATLTNTQISVTYVGLLKTSANTVLTSTAQQITDGDGNNSIMFLSTAGVGIGGSPASGKELDVTGNVQVTGDLIVDNITIDGSTITNASGNLTIVNTTDDADIIFQSDDGSGGVTEYFRADGSSENVLFSKLIKMSDNVEIRLGDGNDLKLNHDGTDSFIRQTGSGDLFIKQEVDDKDLIFQCDDASGGVTTYFKLDGSAGFTVVSKKFRFEDNVNLTLGTADDLSLFHDGTDSTIKNDTGDLIIKNNADDKDIIFQSDNQSGGVETYFFLDGSNGRNRFAKTVFIPDNIEILIGNGDDLNIKHDGTDSIINNNVGDLILKNSANDKDIVFQSDDGSGGTTAYFRLDGANSRTLFSKNLKLSDNVYLLVGSGNDLQLLHNGTNSFVINETGDLTIRNTADDKDIIFESDDASGGVTEYLRLDGSTPTVVFSKSAIFTDNIAAYFGTGLDLQIFHDGSNSFINDNGTGDLYIQTNGTNMFLRDGASGNTFIAMNIGTADVSLKQGGNTKLQTTSTGVTVTGNLVMGTGQVKFADTGKLMLGDSNDLQIYHDGNHSYIQDNGTGDLLVYFDNEFKVIKNGSSETCIEATVDGSVDLFHDGSKKFETSSNGISVTDSTITLGAAGTTGLLQIQQASGTNTSGGSLQLYGGRSTGNAAGGDIQFYVVPAGSAGSSVNSPSQVMHIEASSQNIGIGTTSPAIKLDVDAGASDSVARFTSTDSNARILIADNDDIMYVGTQSNQFYIGPDSSATGNNLIIDSSGNATFAGNVSLADSKNLKLGTGQDFELFHSGTESFISNTTGDLTIQNSADDKDIIFKSDDGSSGTAEYMRIDGSQESIRMKRITKWDDSIKATFGDSTDLQIYHDGTNSFLQNTTGNLTIRNDADDKDIELACDDGSGGVTPYITLDGSEVSTKILTQKVILSNLPTSDPANAGQLYNDSGTLKISAG